MRLPPKTPLIVAIAISSVFLTILVIHSFRHPALAETRPRDYLAGTAQGILLVDGAGTTAPVWSGGEVRKIFRAGENWFALGADGILTSRDGKTWEARNLGLPVKTLKAYENGKKSFSKLIQELKDLEANPAEPNTLIAATKDAVFLSRDAGKTWKDLGFPCRTNGIKAVAVASLPGTTVFVTHAIYGVYCCELDAKPPKWYELNKGLAVLETTIHPDEVSDLAVAIPPAPQTYPAGTKAAPPLPVIYAAQTFKARVYRLDWATRTFTPIWQEENELGTVDSLEPVPGALRFVHEGGIAELAEGKPLQDRTDIAGLAAGFAARAGVRINALASLDGDIALSELWLVQGTSDPDSSPAARRRALAAGHEGFYLPANHAADPAMIKRYLKLIDDRKLNMVVVDMKDDEGRLRWNAKDPAIRAKSRVFNPVDIEGFCSAMKAHGAWTVARVVVFKDEELAKVAGGKYAVWDPTTNAPWRGYFNRPWKDPVTGAVTAQTSWSAEHWVDPYSEEVWDYIAAISKELTARGFDEIQYDYIRFPTDGDNLGNASFRWRDSGMDKESAILSFLAHVRSRISAPLSVDIYGANSWYRTGSRTGQEVELLSHYVDVICPMYYPSHFEQGFLSNPPADQRPWRIYYRGTLRTSRIARGQVVVRPYLQAFFMNVSYDRQYYGAEYVRLQVDGTRKAGHSGLTYWNNVGRYDEIPAPKVD